MAVGDWSAATLCVYGDVRTEYDRAGELTGSSVTETQNTTLTTYIGYAKSDIGEKLDGDLQRLRGGADLDETDIKDNIYNPTVLKKACVALTLVKLFKNNTKHAEDYFYTMMEYYQKEFEKWYTSALSRIQFDIDESGTIEEGEEDAAIASRYRMVRV